MRTIEEITAELVRNMGYIIDELNDKDSMTVEEIKEYKRAKHVIELCQAERENRCVVLPCKVGDILFVPCTTSVMETTVTSVQIYEKCILVTTKNFNKHGIVNTHAFYSMDFGKIVYLTREEAANALKGVRA